jgi:hypothetical protein
MKIRIKGNSLRLRLSRTEVDKLATEGRIEEQTEFNGGIFRYVLQAKKDTHLLDAELEGNTITMYIGAELPSLWANNEQVGYSKTIVLQNGNQLSLLLEKDFKCIDSDSGEDQSDNYEHPSITCN